MIDFSNNTLRMGNRLMTSGTFDTARISQIMSKIFQVLYNVNYIAINFTDKTSCTVKVYKSTNETTLVSDSGSCDYSWGDSKHIVTSIEMLMLYFYCNIDPPTISDDLLINYSEVPAALLIFTIVISAIFTLISVALAVYIIAMRKNEYVSINV